MKKNEFIGRREFFKKSVKGVLPILGGLILVNTQARADVNWGELVRKSKESSRNNCGDCSQSCGKSCTHSCSGSCEGTCSGSCKGDCKGNCSGFLSNVFN